MRAHVQVVGAQAERSAQHDFVEHRRRGVDDEFTIARGAHNPPEVSRIHRSYRNDRFFPEEAPRPLRVAISAPNDVSLAFQQLCKKGARRPRTQDKDSHSASRLYHTKTANRGLRHREGRGSIRNSSDSQEDTSRFVRRLRRPWGRCLRSVVARLWCAVLPVVSSRSVPRAFMVRWISKRSRPPLCGVKLRWLAN